MIEPEYAIFASYGNDSIALIQWASTRVDRGTAVVVHSDTGWSADWWRDRVKQGREWAESLGFATIELASEGLEALVRRKKAWPRQGMQFCTEHLKIIPARRWLDSVDYDCATICMVGVRRAESRARAQWPEWVEESDRHGGRSLWAPLVRHTDAQRNALLAETPFEPLPHRSQECYPCVNANRADLRQVTEERAEEIAAIEKSLGYTSKGKPRTMFRPYRHQGATGIKEVVRWAKSGRGKYRLALLGEGAGCDSGMCGD